MVAVWMALSPCVFGQRVSVGLYDAYNLQSVVVEPQSPGYMVLVGGKKYFLEPRERVEIVRTGESIRLQVGTQGAETAQHAAIIAANPLAQLAVEVTGEAIPARTYDGNLSFYVDFERLMCVNLVDPELYIAAVTLAEVGRGAGIEVYKAQALLVRTYLYANRSRHIAEGYNLCDEVHCQAYKGSAQEYPLVVDAVKATEGLVVVDTRGELITSVFHANRGGETASASDVWLTDYDFLRSVIDPYCRKSRGARWRARVPLERWKLFLQSKGIETSTIADRSYNYESNRRYGLYGLPGGASVPFRDLREYFNLRSALFSVRVEGDEVALSGRGYGHGIGLCQEGAIQMGREGKRAEEIIKFYFYGVSIVPLEAVHPPSQ